MHALVAVMALQAARLPARTDEAGDLILLEDQDRNQWDHQLIAIGIMRRRRLRPRTRVQTGCGPSIGR